MTVFDVFSRQGCHLCEVLIEQLLDLVRGRAEVRIYDVDSRDDWRAKYGIRVPVLELDGRELCEHQLDRAVVMSVLQSD